MTYPPLLVFPGPFAPAYPRSDAPLFELAPDGLEALNAAYYTDAHVVGYLPAKGYEAPRIAGRALRELVEANEEPRLAWAFFDVDNQGHAAHQSPAAALEGLAALRAACALAGDPAEFAGCWATRAGFRLFFPLAEPVPVSRASDFLRAFADKLAEGGILVDRNCLDWQHVFRAPYARRDGVTAPAWPVVAPRYGACPWRPARALRVAVPPPSGASDQGDAPATEAPTAAEFEAVANSALATPYLRAALKKMAAGTPLAEVGGRDKALIGAIASLVDALDAEDPEIPFRFIRASVEADTTEGAPTIAKAWDRCGYFCAKKAGQHADAKRIADLPSPIVLYSGASAMYVYSAADGGYRGPIAPVGLVQAIEEYAPTAGLLTRSEKGTPVTTARILADYAKRVEQTIAVVGLRAGYFRDGTLYEGTAPACPVAGVEHPEIADFLAEFFGESLETGLDWLATARQLDRPTCALYLQGPPGAGKNLFACGVASLWGTGPAEYQDISGNFNSALACNPVVFADETMAGRERNFSANFRKLVGATEHPLRRKGLPTATLRGCIRLIIGANNAQGLALTESLTADDIEAIAQRVAHVVIPASAARYMDKIGNWKTTAGWVRKADGSPGKLAEHAVYLEKTRTVESGRFLVSGRVTEFHENLALNAGLTQNVLGAIAHALLAKESGGATFAEGEAVYVNVPGLRGLWSALLEERPPTERAISAALTPIATGSERKTWKGLRKNYYSVPLRYVQRIAEALQIAEAPDLAQRALHLAKGEQ